MRIEMVHRWVHRRRIHFVSKVKLKKWGLKLNINKSRNNAGYPFQRSNSENEDWKTSLGFSHFNWRRFKGQTQKMRIEMWQLGNRVPIRKSSFKGQTQKMRIEIMPLWCQNLFVHTRFKGQTQKMRIEISWVLRPRADFCHVSKVKLRKWGLKCDIHQRWEHLGQWFQRSNSENEDWNHS